MHPLTDIWWQLFINRTDGALRARGRGWFFDPARLTKVEMSRALSGQHPLGVYGVDATGFSRWLCLDADTDAERAGLVAMAARMEPGTFLFEPSRRGAHLWRFCPPMPWNQVREYGVWLADETGTTCEVFPKGAGRTGVRLPLTRHPKSGQIYPAIEPATGEIVPIERLVQLHAASLPPVVLRRAHPVYDIESHQGKGIQTDFEALFREIAQVTRLRQYGPERAIGHCPFHDDRHPSLSVVGGFWRCWAGCGEGGLNAFRARLKERQIV